MNKKTSTGKRPAPVAPQPPRTRAAPQQPPPAAAAQRANRNTKAYARQDDQAPAPSLDATWDNLHPARIWPD